MLALIFQLLLMPVLAMIIFYAFMSRVAPLGEGWLWKITVILIVMVAAGLIKLLWGIFSPASYWVRLAAIPIMLVISPLWIFQGPVWRRLVVNMLLYCSQMLGEAITVQLLFPMDTAKNVDAFFAQMSPSQLLLYAALSQGGCVILYSIVVILARSLIARRFSLIYLPVFFLPCSLWGMMMGHFSDFAPWVWFLCICLGCGATIILLYYIISLEEKDILKEKVQELRHTIALEQAHYRTVEERQEELARIRHDFNNHLSAIGRLAEAGEMEDVRQMIMRLKEDVISTQGVTYCPIPVVNAVLAEKARACKERNIALAVSLEIPRGLSVEPLHLCSIFANLLDNAINGAAASGQEQPEITLSTRAGGDYLFIKTVNPGIAPDISGAPAALGCGRGIPILKDIASRYGGSYMGSFDKGIFTAQVSLLAVPYSRAT